MILFCDTIAKKFVLVATKRTQSLFKSHLKLVAKTKEWVDTKKSKYIDLTTMWMKSLFESSSNNYDMCSKSYFLLGIAFSGEGPYCLGFQNQP